MPDEVLAVLIDDSEDDQRYAARLTAVGLPCEVVPLQQSSDDVVADVVGRVEDGRCDIALIDYRLDAEQQESVGGRVSYRGGSIAAGIRERVAGIPLVLITTESWYEAYLSEAPQLRGLFDAVVLKKRLSSRAERPKVATELVELAAGFRQIGAANPTGWTDVSDLLQADATSLGDLDGASLPVGTAAIAGWILEELLAFSGPTVDEHDAAAIMGIAIGSFRRQDAQALLAESKYGGVFSSTRERWWRHRLEMILQELIGDTARSSAANRAKKVAESLNLTGHQIRSARCTWCGGSEVARACTLCREPVDPSHGLVTTDSRPAWAARGFVCFTCVQTGRADGVSFQRGTDAIVERIRSGELAPESPHGS